MKSVLNGNIPTQTVFANREGNNMIKDGEMNVF